MIAQKCDQRSWLIDAIRRIKTDVNRASDAELIRIPLTAYPNIDLYLKDESIHLTGSLKHRLAHSLFIDALCNEKIGPDTPIIEASSGSTAVSVAYFSHLLNLRFIAVVPRTTAQPKLDAIRQYGGEVHEVDHSGLAHGVALRLAAELNGHYLDQFTNAERATEWRGSNNIAESLFNQLSTERFPEPTWVVCGAGTGGTSATLGRFIRYQGLNVGLCVADPDHSVFHRHHADPSILHHEAGRGSFIEGIGRQRVEPSFLPQLVDRMSTVTDAQSIGAMRWVSQRLGRRVGGSTGTNIWACSVLIEEMNAGNQPGSIATLLCDSGERYADTYFNDGWLAERGVDWKPAFEALSARLEPMGAGRA